MSGVRPATPSRPGFPRIFLVVVGLAATVIVVIGLRQLSGIVGPAFLALVLVLGIQPMRLAMERHGLPGWAAGTVSVMTVYVALIGFTVAMTVTVARFATLLPTYQAEMNQVLGVVVDWLGRQGVGEDQIERIVGGLDFSRIVSLATDLVSGVVGLLTSLFFVITLVLFMVADASRFSRRLAALPAAHEPWVAALTAFGSSVRRYIVVSTVFGLIVAVLDTIALAWMGVPIAVLWGLLAFITNYIPNIGFVIGVVPPAVIGLLEGGPRLMVGVLVVYSVLNVVVQTIIQPKIVGDAVGLSTTITMLSLVFWAYALGGMGALLAVPLTLLVKAMLIDADPRVHWVAPLLTGERQPGDARRARRERKARAAQPRAAGR
jgi:predicted PurR-regulated permease PerM